MYTGNKDCNTNNNFFNFLFVPGIVYYTHTLCLCCDCFPPLQLTMTLSGDQDMQILSQVRKTATRSKQLMGDLQNLKAKIYSLENDVRHVHD